MQSLIEKSYRSDKINIKGLSQPETVKRQARRVLNELHQVVGPQSQISINLEPLSPKKGLYHLTLSAEHDGTVITVDRQGKRINSLLNKTKKALKNIARDLKDQRIKRRKRCRDDDFFKYWGVA